MSSLTSIGIGAFVNNQLTSVTLPASLTSIGNNAFQNNQLTSLDLSGLSSLTSIGIGAFAHNTLTSFILPLEDAWSGSDGSTYAPNMSVTDLNIYYNRFPSPYPLRDENVVVTGGVLTSYTPPGFNPQEIVIPNRLDGQTITSIGVNAFQGSRYSGTQLTSVILPASLTSIGDFAFSGNQLTSVTLPSSLQFIGSSAFSNNSGLTSFTLPLGDDWSGSDGNTYAPNMSVTNLVLFYNRFPSPYPLRDENVVVTDGVLTSYTPPGFNPREIIILDMLDNQTITSIGQSAFSSKQLTSIDLSGLASLTSIGNNAFQNNQLTSLDLSGLSSLTSIGSQAFQNNTLTSFTLPPGDAWLGSDRNTYAPNIPVTNLNISYELPPPARLYVKEGGTGNGTSWDDAATLARALTRAGDGTEVWVAAGTHRPNEDRFVRGTFSVPAGVEIYGGFDGGRQHAHKEISSPTIQLLSLAEEQD